MKLNIIYKCIENFLTTKNTYYLYFIKDEFCLKILKKINQEQIKKETLILLYTADFENFDKLYSKLKININMSANEFIKNINDENLKIFHKCFIKYFNVSNNFNSFLNDISEIAEQYYFECIKEKSILKYLRLKKEITAKDAAKLLNCHIQQIYDWESGKRTPNYIHIKKLAEIYNISAKDLLFSIKEK